MANRGSFPGDLRDTYASEFRSYSHRNHAQMERWETAISDANNKFLNSQRNIFDPVDPRSKFIKNPQFDINDLNFGIPDNNKLPIKTPDLDLNKIDKFINETQTRWIKSIGGASDTQKTQLTGEIKTHFSSLREKLTEYRKESQMRYDWWAKSLTLYEKPTREELAEVSNRGSEPPPPQKLQPTAPKPSEGFAGWFGSLFTGSPKPILPPTTPTATHSSTPKKYPPPENEKTPNEHRNGLKYARNQILASPPANESGPVRPNSLNATKDLRDAQSNNLPTHYINPQEVRYAEEQKRKSEEIYGHYAKAKTYMDQEISDKEVSMSRPSQEDFKKMKEVRCDFVNQFLGGGSDKDYKEYLRNLGESGRERMFDATLGIINPNFSKQFEKHLREATTTRSPTPTPTTTRALAPVSAPVPAPAKPTSNETNPLLDIWRNFTDHLSRANPLESKAPTPSKPKAEAPPRPAHASPGIKPPHPSPLDTFRHSSQTPTAPTPTSKPPANPAKTTPPKRNLQPASSRQTPPATGNFAERFPPCRRVPNVPSPGSSGLHSTNSSKEMVIGTIKMSHGSDRKILKQKDELYYLKNGEKHKLSSQLKDGLMLIPNRDQNKIMIAEFDAINKYFIHTLCTNEKEFSKSSSPEDLKSILVSSIGGASGARR